jgi:hypothetical protein
MILYAVQSPYQRLRKNGYHFISPSIARAVTEAVIVARRRKQRMCVVIYKGHYSHVRTRRQIQRFLHVRERNA